MGRKEKAAETEAALKAAAKRVFAERGYLNTKITDITAEAGRSTGSFYSHFSSKEALLEALMADMGADSDMMSHDADHSADFTDPDAIRFHVAAYISVYRRHSETVRAMQQALLVSEQFAARLAEFRSSALSDILDHITSVATAGRQLPASPENSLRIAFAMLDTALESRQQGEIDLDDTQLIEALTRFLYRGLNGCDY
ncbi:TetR/AcrR family transcriptional regulator [Streptomyces coffeae]|uniref:TetR/AcrR family transcriptional regulator n=1 Tax=Streptomyces coffeae TaxID=621382 RepID=A0ABS1NPF3_9ACTN|nr:TetR/AcrR family transcriptional regulator [Streptomyces coffeae]MBL1101971.1 TetR/AcrR family transcriptional regulator [Streptomyces coffeae]